MALKFYNQAPYFDDFDEAKNYLRVLFRPGHAVQARELTQLQTVLQNQIARFGEHVFKDGTRIIGGDPTLNQKLDYVKVTTANAVVDFTEGMVLTGGTTGVQAQVLSAVEIEGADPFTIFVRYIQSGSNNATQTFAPDETLLGTGVTATVQSIVNTPTGFGTSYSVLQGIYFVNGNFVFSPAQEVIVSKYSDVPSARIVMTITESIITDSNDVSLNDNAIGSPNEAAPGAHRYNINLTLSVEDIDIDLRTQNDMFQIAVLENGILQRQAKSTEYNEILKIFARRTFEESGNYTVRPFEISFQDHPTNAEKLQAVLQPSKAYVNGYRVETISDTYIDIDRSRVDPDDVETLNSSAVFINYDNYVSIPYANLTGDLSNISSYALVQIRTTANAQIGSCRIRGIEDDSAGNFKIYLFDVQFDAGKSIASAGNLFATGGSGNFVATLTLDSVASPAQFEGTKKLSIFPLAYDSVKTIESGSIEIYTKRYLTALSSATVENPTIGKAVFPTGSVDEWFADTSNIVVCNTDTGTIDQVFTVTPTGTNPNELSQITISGLAVNANYAIWATTWKRNTTSTPKSKTLNTAATTTINISALGAGESNAPGGYLNIGFADIYKINSILMSNGAPGAGGPYVQDITERYILDDGQRDTFYDNGRLRLRYGFPAATGDIQVNFDYFSHGAGDFFTVDSYTGQVAWDEIPTYTTGNRTYKLHSVIDARPRIDSNGTTFTNPGDFPATNKISSMNLDIYLPRFDKIYLRETGQFGVIRGVSDIEPSIPKDLENTMSLYTLAIHPYTGDSQRDISARLIDNRRYTMRDIGRLETRIKNLEYYTSLSLLESSVLQTDVGTRQKNGFIVDNFNGHQVGDTSNQDYQISMDIKNGLMRPFFYQDAVGLKVDPNTALTNAQKHQKLITLGYDAVTPHVAILTQPYASTTENTNPYLVFNYNGNLQLSPSTDDWIDTEVRPTVTIDQTGVYDAIRFLAEETGVTGAFWNGWETNWTGQEISRTVNEGFNRTTTTTTTTNIGTRDNTGIQIEVVPETVETNIGNRVVDVNFVPFIRPRKIFFYANRLKPNTKVYLFFDDVDISAYARPETQGVYNTWVASDNTEDLYRGATSHPDGTADLITDANGEIWGSFIVPSNDTLRFNTGQRVVKLTDDSLNRDDIATTQAFMTFAAQGLIQAVEGTVISTTVPQFESSEIFASEPIVSVSVDTQVEWIDDGGGGGGGGGDPLAQTFTVNEPGGCFVTKADFYFRTKSSTATIVCQIRPVVNGYPTKQVMAEASLAPGAVNVSATAAVATTFTFPDPVYLLDGVEYAIVLKGNDSGYEAWVSELGAFDVTNTNFRISEQPAAGVLFKSANGGTWTADQFRDIKCTIYRANFNIADGVVTLTNKDIPARELTASPFLTYNGSATVRVLQKNHGFSDGQSVTISGVAIAVNGIPFAELNGTHTVAKVETDSYEITVTTTATSSGKAGGTGIRATENKTMNLLRSQIQNVVIPDTNASWRIRTTQVGNAGADAAYVDILPNVNLEFQNQRVIPSTDNEIAAPNRNLYLQTTIQSSRQNLSPVLDMERMSVITVSNRVDNAVEEANHINGVTTRVYKDPLSAIRFVPETNPNSNSGLSRYITKKVVLENTADDLTIWLTGNRPSNTFVDVYVRFDLDDGNSFEDKDWELVTGIAGVTFTELPQNDNLSVFNEAVYELDDVGPFTGFQVKIVLRSTTTSKVPQLKDFRALAINN